MNGDTRYQIDVANEQTLLAVDESRLRAAVAEVLSDARQTAATVSVAVVDDATIHELNRTYLQHDYPTDVLSFSLAAPGEPIDGQIVVSAETARGQAADWGWSAEHELLLYVVHGALHLTGYDDQTRADAHEMRAAERKILARLHVEFPETAELSAEREERNAT